MRCVYTEIISIVIGKIYVNHSFVTNVCKKKKWMLPVVYIPLFVYWSAVHMCICAYARLRCVCICVRYWYFSQMFLCVCVMLRYRQMETVFFFSKFVLFNSVCLIKGIPMWTWYSPIWCIGFKIGRSYFFRTNRIAFNSMRNQIDKGENAPKRKQNIMTCCR